MSSVLILERKNKQWFWDDNGTRQPVTKSNVGYLFDLVDDGKYELRPRSL